MIRDLFLFFIKPRVVIRKHLADKLIVPLVFLVVAILWRFGLNIWFNKLAATATPADQTTGQMLGFFHLEIVLFVVAGVVFWLGARLFKKQVSGLQVLHVLTWALVWPVSVLLTTPFWSLFLSRLFHDAANASNSNTSLIFHFSGIIALNLGFLVALLFWLPALYLFLCGSELGGLGLKKSLLLTGISLVGFLPVLWLLPH